MASTQNYQRMLALKDYLRMLSLRAVTGLPTEGMLYTIFIESAFLHQQQHRFVILPLMNLEWKPQDVQDSRSKVADLGLGDLALPGRLPHFKLRCGVKAKRAIDIMTSLPPASSIMRSYDVASVFHALSFEAQNQAKAAHENQLPLSDDGVQWILLVGPYWISKSFGPFSEAESIVGSYKISDSSDFEATMELLDSMQGPPPLLDELFLLGTQESFVRLEEIIASTDQLAQPFIQAMNSWYFTARSELFIISLIGLPELA